jgi:hypothetical protein
VSVLGPEVAKTKEQLPPPEISVPEQLSPVEALMLTDPVGMVIPVTVKSTVTACPGSDGSGVFDVIVAVLIAFRAKVDWLAVAAVKLFDAGHEAVREQVPEPLIMVTVSPRREQAPVAVSVGVVPSLEVADTVKVD